MIPLTIQDLEHSDETATQAKNDYISLLLPHRIAQATANNLKSNEKNILAAIQSKLSGSVAAREIEARASDAFCQYREGMEAAVLKAAKLDAELKASEETMKSERDKRDSVRSMLAFQRESVKRGIF